MTPDLAPEAAGALALVRRHLESAEHWRWSTCRRPRRRRELIARHRSKAQKLMARAERLGWVSERVG